MESVRFWIQQKEVRGLDLGGPLSASWLLRARRGRWGSPLCQALSPRLFSLARLIGPRFPSLQEVHFLPSILQVRTQRLRETPGKCQRPDADQGGSDGTGWAFSLCQAGAGVGGTGSGAVSVLRADERESCHWCPLNVTLQPGSHRAYLGPMAVQEGRWQELACGRTLDPSRATGCPHASKVGEALSLSSLVP